MKCQDTQELITRYAVGELSRESRVRLERHLADCPSCREELALAVRLEDLLEHPSPVTSPAGLVDRIMTAVDLQDQESLEREVIAIARERDIWSARRDFLPSMSFALAVIFISIGLMIWWPSFDEYLSLLVHGAAQMNSTALISTPAGGIEENLNLIITGLMVLSSLFIVVGNMLPVRIRWRDTLLPF